jgi:hypothetical protein
MRSPFLICSSVSGDPLCPFIALLALTLRVLSQIPCRSDVDSVQRSASYWTSLSGPSPACVLCVQNMVTIRYFYSVNHGWMAHPWIGIGESRIRPGIGEGPRWRALWILHWLFASIHRTSWMIPLCSGDVSIRMDGIFCGSVMAISSRTCDKKLFQWLLSLSAITRLLQFIAASSPHTRGHEIMEREIICLWM